MWFDDLSFWVAILSGGTIGAVISALATIFYGEKRVETLRLRREHSKKLLDVTLKPWLDTYKQICVIGAEYSNDLETLVAHEPQETSLRFFAEIRSHLKSKYADILKSWDTLKEATLEHNRKLALVLEDVRKAIFKEVSLPLHHGFGRRPTEYIRPEPIVKNIYDTMAHETRTGEDWFQEKPTVDRYSSGNTMFYQMQWGDSSRLVVSRNEDFVKKIVDKTIDIVESPAYDQKIRQAVETEDKVIQPKRVVFEQKMEDLVESIELGNYLRGKCKHCRDL